MKKKMLFLVLAFAIVGIIWHKKIERFFIEKRYYKYLVKAKIAQECFYSDIPYIFKLSGLDFLEVDQQATKLSYDKLVNLDQLIEKHSIPLISHRIYFTDEKKPSKISEAYLEVIKDSYKRLNKADHKWKHYVWTNMPSLFPEELLAINGVEVRSLEEFKDDSLYDYLKNSLVKGSESKVHYMVVSDALRLMVIGKFGGVYSDIDYEIYNAEELMKYIHKFDFIIGREFEKDFSYYGNAFFASKAKHLIIEDAIAKMKLYSLDIENERVPIYLKKSCSLFTRSYLKSPSLLTLSYLDKSNKEGANDIVLPSWMLFNVNFARKKNGDCLSLVDKNIMIERSNNLPKLLDEYIEEEIKKTSIKDTSGRIDIYYNLKDGRNFRIIGADMFCGSWSRNQKDNLYIYWNWPWSLFLDDVKD